MLIAFNKPYGVLSQFTKEHEAHRTLAEFAFPAKVYPIGRLDSDSEGLLLLSDEAQWNDKLLHPRHAHRRTYHAQVEGIPTESALKKLTLGVSLPDFTTLPCQASIPAPAPDHAPRVPPIRVRKTVTDTWLELTLTEGKNRQVRRMTAAVGFPTLRLIRVAMGDLTLAKLALPPGQWRVLNEAETKLILRR